MFTAEEKVRRLSELEAARLQREDVILARKKQHLPTPEDFGRPPIAIEKDFANEGRIMIFYGEKSQFEDVLHFLYTALEDNDYNTGDSSVPAYFIQKIQPRSLTEAAFEQFVKTRMDAFYWFSDTPRKRMEWKLEPRYLRGYELENEWNSVAALAEFENGYVLFHWGTNA